MISLGPMSRTDMESLLVHWRMALWTYGMQINYGVMKGVF